MNSHSDKTKGPGVTSRQHDACTRARSPRGDEAQRALHVAPTRPERLGGDTPGQVRRQSTKQHDGPLTLVAQRFQALFNSLFKVLCIFRSHYLFAIGLGPIFSLR